MSEALVVITTTETFAEAERLAHQLVERELAACIQILPQVTSVYRWQGKVEQANEALLLIKTTSGAYAKLEEAIKELHSYQTPEIMALSATAVSADYLAWIQAAVTSIS
jgi:periplasmic divalent cation tolerance protein